MGHQQPQNQNMHALAELGLASAAIIHEIKNSLQSVANALLLLEKESGLSPHSRQLVAIARQELSRTFDVSAQSLSLVREETPVAVSMANMLEEVLNTYAAKIEHKHITVERRYDFNGTIQGSPGAIRQIFSNIVINALESAPCETGKLSVHTYACHEKSEAGKVQGVQIEFADNGPGIPNDLRERIFEPLFSTKNGKGSGLGLWVTRRLVLKQSGWLRLLGSSEGGHSGTCFSIFLPLNPPQM